MTLPDNAFFELVRTVFGKVKTPFNKQILASDLEKFLLRGDIQKNVAKYIGRNDARIIATVAFLNEPTPDDMETFFSGELNYAELNDMLINLEERFILYRFLDEDKKQGAKRLAMNPVFKPILSPFIADTSLLFPSIHASEMPIDGKDEEENPFDANTDDKNSRRPFLYDDRIPAVMLSFVSMNEFFFKTNGGGIRQKIVNSAKTLFPNLSLETLIEGMMVLGMFSAKGEKLQPDYRRFSAFGRLSRQERAEYYTAGILCHMESVAKEGAADPHDSAISPWLMRSKVRSYAKFIHRFHKMLDPDRLYPFASLRKLAYILERENTEFCRDRLLKTMEETGLLVLVADNHWRKRSFVPLPPPETEAAPSEGQASQEGQSKAVVVMDASFSLMVYPEIDYNDLVMIAAFCHVTEANLSVRFELNRDSAVSAFNLGIAAASIIELLQKLSQNRIDENMIYALQDWEKSHKEVTLRQGLVLTLSPERRYLAETKPLSMFIKETLAPGVYMLPETLEDRAVRALNSAGVNIISRQSEHGDENRFPDKPGIIDGFSSNFYPALRTISFGSGIFPQSAAPQEKTEEAAEDEASAYAATDAEAQTLTEGFRSALKKMRFDKEKNDELEARIERRLILCESQLKDVELRYEKLEARGLDYIGKTLIAKQAIAMQSLVEAAWPGKQKQERVMGFPKALDKSGNEAVLSIKPMDDDGGGGIIQIPLGKISLLRRIKRSIFENNTV